MKKRYDEKISDNVRTILTEQGGIQIRKNINIDETAIPYNFIGNQKKPFYLCTWLASKSVPVISIEGESNVDGRGGAAGYFFFENYEGFQFRSLDKLLDKKRDPVKKYIYTGNESYPPEYDGHITSVSMDRDIDLQQNLALGTYANRSIFFNYASMEYLGRDYNIVDNQKDKIVNAGEHDIAWVAPAFREGPSRLMNHILDVGTGGGFPGIPLAILFPDCTFHLVDSIQKKIKVVDAVSKELGLKNVTAQCKRIEDMDDKFDFILIRAVADMSTILKWTENNITPNSNNVVANGIIALKGGDLDKELYSIENKKIVAIKDYFDDHYFINKKLVYLPIQ